MNSWILVFEMMRNIPDRESTRERVIRGRISGETYATLSLNFGASPATVGRWCREAIPSVPVETKRKIRVKRTRVDDVDYDEKWVSRVRGNVTISESGCWLWQGGTSIKGYGQTGYRGRTRSIHRCMYKIANKVDLTTKQYVCHRCDTPRCCNPDRYENAHKVLVSENKQLQVIKDLARDVLDAYDQRFGVREGGHYIGPIDTEILALRAAVQAPEVQK